eukprot:gb/GEZJ01003419.1/.p1 GENE.gb/GEZJ01003419.1/~~gb/GEZJ01003419.1/.p1  ORF type:complete len:563 (+),score=65.72 gb/GEZJ01003419.1/:139-1689(+)
MPSKRSYQPVRQSRPDRAKTKSETVLDQISPPKHGLPYATLPPRFSIPSPSHPLFPTSFAKLLRTLPIRFTLNFVCDYPALGLDSILRMNLSEPMMIKFARQLEYGPVGRRGFRIASRYVALGILHHVILRSPDNIEAQCLKGELLLSFLHYGRNGLFIPRTGLEEALNCFETASDKPLGLFLKGRLMLTMEAIHKDTSKAALGKQLVLKAADDGCARALVFLAHRYEYPQLDRAVSFSSDVPKDRDSRERFIVGLYEKAAAADDPDALNDLGTSYAQEYGGLDADFDSVVKYYLRAIMAGSLHAFDNLGTHYETGMGMRFPDKVDYDLALFYYRQGARKGCPKCAYNMGAAYEEGMGDTLPRDIGRAEKYYSTALKLSSDCGDLQTMARTVRDLCALYATKIKLGNPNDEETLRCDKKLRNIIPSDAGADELMNKVNRGMSQIIRKRSTSVLTKLVGEENARLLAKRVRSVWKNNDNMPEEERDAIIQHLTGGEPVDQRTPPRKKRATGKRKAKS